MLNETVAVPVTGPGAVGVNENDREQGFEKTTLRQLPESAKAKGPVTVIVGTKASLPLFVKLTI